MDSILVLLKNKVKYIEDHIEKLEKIVLDVNKKNMELKKEIVELKYDKLITNIIIALQDLNLHYKFEENTNIYLSDTFRTLQKFKICTKSYINKTDSNSLKKYKKLILYNKLQELPDYVLDYFADNISPYFISNTIQYLSYNIDINVIASKKEKEKVYRWWG